jgi:DNA-binding PadR family transcriptional regulator
MSKPTDLVQGTVDFLMLVSCLWSQLHGWAIAQRIRQMSNEQLRVGQSALYPALHKLEQQGWEVRCALDQQAPATPSFAVSEPQR